MMTSETIIYVVDDDPSVRKATARMFRAAGFRVIPFDSAEEFLRGLGCSGQLRVRHYTDTARIEVEAMDLPLLIQEGVRQQVVEHLKGLAKLENLQLFGTEITDAGLVHLKGLTRLEYLSLRGTQVTDAGLVHLKGLTSLGDLDLSRTKVTDAGVADLQRALPEWCDTKH